MSSRQPSEPTVVASAADLDATSRRLAAEIDTANPDGIVLVGILKGSLPFLADLSRKVTVDCIVDFLAITTYAPDTGRVRIAKDLDVDIGGRDVVLVEDIVDTGLTLAYILGELGRRGPRAVSVCALFDKLARRIAPARIDYVGYQVADPYLLGYGIDYAGRYRNLEMVVAGDLDALRADPDAHVHALYPL